MPNTYKLQPIQRALFGLTLLIFSSLAGCSTATQTGPQVVPTMYMPAASASPLVIPITPSPSASFRDVFILSMDEFGYAHLFVFSPQALPLTRLTYGAWNDITPALSPDGSQIAFASQRDGYWDLYLLNLVSGETTRLTNTPEYDAAPSWSPDGRWLVFETYLDNNLEIAIMAVDDITQAPIRLTNNSAGEHSPVWSPKGRQIAYVSNRSGESEIWLADLDQPGEERFLNISRDPQGSQKHPTWSPDGEQLAWASNSYDTGMSEIRIWDSRTPETSSRLAGSGDWPAWTLDGKGLVTRLSEPNECYLSGYTFPAGELALPPVKLPGTLHGLNYGGVFLGSPLPSPIQEAALQTPAPLYTASTSTTANIPGGRLSLVNLQGILAPYPQLLESVDEAFLALQQRTNLETGWEALSSLENAFVPLSTPLDPGRGEDWLYTGRAFALNSILTDAGWMAVMREDLGQQTYWRIYLRTLAQDGSRGIPLHEQPWDFSTRYNGNARSYEQGGSLADSIPPGYWIDFTALALQYDWERLPALFNWRSYYSGAQFNEFALIGEVNWYAAMLEIYPPEALLTPTVVIPPTRTPTRTPWWYRPPTATQTLTPGALLTQQP